MHIVLLEPEIPQNAGNIARTCAVTNTVLHLIKPLGFSVEDKYLKRAGLDYWKLLDIRYYENFQDFLDKNPNAKIWMATTKAKHVYSDVTFGENDYLMFGKESAGIPEEILLQYPDTAIRIPMLEAPNRFLWARVRRSESIAFRNSSSFFCSSSIRIFVS